MDNRLAEVQSWYNGYLFGGQVLYNPWSVLSFVKHQPDQPQPYWANIDRFRDRDRPRFRTSCFGNYVPLAPRIGYASLMSASTPSNQPNQPQPRSSEGSEIPKEALRAPTQEAWDAMTPEERLEAIDRLVCSTSQEELDTREAMAEGDDHYDAKEEIRDSLRKYFGSEGNVYVGAERKVYYPGQKGFTPDIIIIIGVSPHKRDCWSVSQEGRGIDVAIEVHCKGDWRKDFFDDVRDYAALGIPEYFIFDVRRKTLTGYRLPEGGSSYQPIQPQRLRYRSMKLGLELAVRQGHLRFFQGTALVPTAAELLRELEEVAAQEAARADLEAARAEEEEARATEEEARANEEQTRATQAIAGLIEGILLLANARGLLLTAAEVDRIRACTDPTLLSRWMGRLAQLTQEEHANGRLFMDA